MQMLLITFNVFSIHAESGGLCYSNREGEDEGGWFIDATHDCFSS